METKEKQSSKKSNDSLNSADKTETLGSYFLLKRRTEQSDAYLRVVLQKLRPFPPKMGWRLYADRKH